ncbi:transcriptional activator NhaR [Thiobacillus sp.]|uniref:transcriptional activator NhaR n=1 Tax=Thiobacillus sp. TaxID=924 RepID=UPI0011DBADB3|nr:transcriptional activator NhaR [Thiobacillus sp.]MBC2730111.1 transcriptional activator NhaR [Thiobacillus sp.]MBC2738849.1 transcriptional activator NhaR [Thiobacillus sp.]MBC2760859.1 transcriptional activator NhaR [Thiobacillus sp.]TXH74566.1 MAG: transcriptional activator NhaR [Thiobacillus sp.]
MLNYKHLYYFRTVAKAGALNRAAEKLHLTPQTLSGQISTFEERLGVTLFRRSGRRLELTDAGRTALVYADDIFQVGAELEDALQNRLAPRAYPFRVGIADVVPKAIAYQLLAPALALAEPVKLVCREDRLEQLAAELSIHRLDMVLADRPLPATMDIKGYSHPLGECGIAFVAARSIGNTLEQPFPANLHGVPLLIPGEDSALRVPLLRWLERKDIQPTIVGEFDDSALMSAFGQAGAGVFPVPLTTVQDVMRQYDVSELGRTHEIRERFFAISVERRLSHPAVLAVSEAARRRFQPQDI